MPNRKEHLFSKGAHSIRRLSNHHGSLYACPLCLRVFDAPSLVEGDLTLEHVPPASVGGRGIALTCRECNSKAGHKIEAQLHRQQEVMDFIRAVAGKGKFSGRVKVEMSDVETNVNAEFEEGKLKMDFPEEINNPLLLGNQVDHLNEMVEEDTWDGNRFRLTPVTKFNARIANLSYLKAAYLAAFASLGYTYVASKRLESVRVQIAEPEEKTIPSYMVELPSTHERAYKMISVEKPFRAIAVQMERKLVFLPPVEPSKAFYDNLPHLLNSCTSGERLAGSQWPFPTTLDLQLDLATHNT